MFGIIFASFAVVMGSFVVKDHLADREILQWVPTPCTIEKSRVETSRDGEYSFSANFSYQFGGRNYTGNQYSRNLRSYSVDSVAEKNKLLESYPEGKATTCYVSPQNPSMAVLTRGSGSLPWLELLFMVPFVVIGLGVAFGPWVSRSRKKRAVGFESPTQKDISSKRLGKVVMIIFGGVFVAAGIGVLSQSLPPLQEWWASASWVETPAVVTASAVRENSDNDSTTYYPYIAYSYDFNGKTYEGDKYVFFKVSSSGYDGKAEVVRAHPVGREIKIFVDPQNPERSVINRDAEWSAIISILFPFIFIGVGSAIFIAGLMMRNTPAAAFDRSRKNKSGRNGRPVPPIKKTTTRQIFGAMIFAFLWNGILSIFVFKAWSSIKEGRPEWVLIIFLIPFVVVGLVAIGVLLKEFLRILNPKIEVIPDSGNFSLDKPIRLRFRATGSMHRVISLKVTLHGVETISVSDGDLDSSEEHEFFTATLVETSNPHDMTRGELEVKLPPDAMHSFESAHASIQWRLTVVGQIPFWPGIKDEYLLSVHPSKGDWL